MTLVPIRCIIKSKTLKLYRHVKCSQFGLSKICLEGIIVASGVEVDSSRDAVTMYVNDPAYLSQP